jgi:hypothetical protein
VAKIRASFAMDVPPARAQAMFERDIVPSLYRNSPYRLAGDRPGELVFSDGAVDFNRVFDPRRVVEGENPPRRRAANRPAPPPERPRPRLMGVVAPNVEHRQPWLYASLRRASSRKLVVRFEPAGEGGTRVSIEGKAERRLRDALSRLGSPGSWPEASEDRGPG